MPSFLYNMSKKKKQKLTWQTGVAEWWSKYMPPARPSKSELKIFEDYIEKAPKQGEILILGCTPELRDLVLKYQRRPVSADLNPKNFSALKKLMKYQGRERFIQGNWLKLKEKNKFDLVIGHLSFNMLPFSNWDRLIRIIYRSLRPKGKLIHAVSVRYPKDRCKNILDIFKGYRRKRSRGHIYYEIGNDLVLAICDIRRNYADFEILGRKLNNLYKSQKITKEEYRGIIDVQVSRALKLTLPLKTRIDSLFKKYFSGVRIVPNLKPSVSLPANTS